MLDKLQEAINVPGYQKNPEIEIEFLHDTNKQMEGDENEVFYNNENIKGVVIINPNSENTFKYKNINIELLAYIHSTNSNDYNFEFMHISKQLDGQGEVSNIKKFPFSFDKISSNMESVNGDLLCIEYKIKVLVSQGVFSFYKEIEKPFIYKSETNEENIPKLFGPVKHNLIRQGQGQIDFIFELSKIKLNIGEPLIGKLIFNRVQLYIRSIELILIRSEKLKDKTSSTIISRFEMCDGQPFDLEVLPIKYLIDKSSLTQSMRNINNGTSWVRYFLKLAIHVDDNIEDNILYKTQEIIFYRKK